MYNYCLVRCAQYRCGWIGRIMPTRDGEPWNGFEPTVILECPRCRTEWRARIVGNQADPLPMDDADEDLAVWPPVELGVGD